MSLPLEIFHSNDPDAIMDKIAGGYCAVECSIGGDSLICDLSMDHHGPNSHLEGVAVRAYRDHYGARRESPFFVVTGKGDGDATFAIAALIGALPHPLNDITDKPWLAGFDRDISPLANLVNKMDTDPIGCRLEEEGPNGALLLLFNQTGSEQEDATSFHAGVDRWRWLTGSPSNALLSAALLAEEERVAFARKAVVTEISGDVAVVESAAWGFDVWYGDLTPCVVALTPEHNITVGCPNTETAEKMFGPGGLKNIFPVLEPEGWGGREAIGGSPRGARMTLEQALAAARKIASMVQHD